MGAGHAREACPKYADSQRLDPQLGTLLHLGECYAKIGKTASAWASFRDADEIASSAHRPARAEDSASASRRSGRRLSELVVTVSDPAGGSRDPARRRGRQQGRVGHAGSGRSRRAQDHRERSGPEGVEPVRPGRGQAARRRASSCPRSRSRPRRAGPASTPSSGAPASSLPPAAAETGTSSSGGIRRSACSVGRPSERARAGLAVGVIFQLQKSSKLQRSRRRVSERHLSRGELRRRSSPHQPAHERREDGLDDLDRRLRRRRRARRGRTRARLHRAARREPARRSPRCSDPGFQGAMVRSVW